MKQSRAKPNVVRYHDYRVFLKDWMNYLVSTGQYRSIREISRKSGLTNSFLHMMFSGRRPLSNKAFQKLAENLYLSESEIRFVDSLRVIADSNTQRDRSLALERVQRSAEYQRLNEKESLVYEYLSHWHYVAIREMAFCKGFKLEAKWIQKRLRKGVSLGEIQEAIDFLLEHGFIEKSKGGTVKVRDVHLECNGEVFRLALGQFHHATLKLISDSITDTPRDKRNLYSETIAIDASKHSDLKEEIARVIEGFRRREGNKKGSNSVYHFGFYGIPLTRS